LITEFNGISVAVINLQGRVFMPPIDCPFQSARSILQKLGENVNLCSRCFNFTNKEHSECEICRNSQRDKKTICVVAKQQDLMLIENIHEYKGQYHVLQGIINPIEGLTPDKLRIKELLTRIGSEKIEEVILALDADINGETTILYLQKRLKDSNIKTSRLARGIPIGASLEYADEATLSNAFKGRREI
jgi:recombination protein RecR